MAQGGLAARRERPVLVLGARGGEAEWRRGNVPPPTHRPAHRVLCMGPRSVSARPVRAAPPRAHARPGRWALRHEPGGACDLAYSWAGCEGALVAVAARRLLRAACICGGDY